MVIRKCGSCHERDERGNMQRISWARTTPEGWQEVLKQMVLSNGLALTPAEARPILKYLSTSHGLAPEESRPVMYDAERRFYEETMTPADPALAACTKCHSAARPLSWRRSPAEWKRFADSHAARYKFRPSEAAIVFLAKAAPLHGPEWDTWSAHTAMPELSGRWLVTASIPGRGKYYGDIQVDKAGEDEFATRVILTSVKDGSAVLRTGRSAVYGGSAWRGRSSGGAPTGSPPDDPTSDAREVMWISPDHTKAEGRWFWGQYQEFGFDVQLQRPSSEPTLLVVDRSSMKVGSQGNRVRVMGDTFPAQVTPADLQLGPGVLVRSIVSRTATSIVADVDVSADARPGKRDVAVRGSLLPGAVAIYDRVDYVKVTPESAMAAFGDRTHPRGYQPFEAIGYQDGADGKPHTADDVELGPVDVNWSIQVFHAADDSSADFVGKMSPAGLLTPASTSPGNNFDVWVIATARDEKDAAGQPLIGKSYVVVTIPTYSLNGHQYVRELDRWVEVDPATGSR